MEKKLPFSFKKKEKLTAYDDASIHELHKQLKLRTEAKKSKDKERTKEKEKHESLAKEKKPKLSFKKRIVNLWFGVDKEINKIVWVKGRQLIIIFLLILLVSGFMVGIFFGINQLLITLGIFKN